MNMKRFVIALLCLGLPLAPAFASGPVQLSRECGAFSGIDAGGQFELTIVKGTQGRVLITIEDVYEPYLICQVKGSVLKLSIDERKVPSDVKRMFRGRATPDPVFSAVVYVGSALQSVTLSDKAVLASAENEVFDPSRCSFSLSDNSSVKDLTISSESLRIIMQNKAVAKLDASCGDFSVEQSNSSNLDVKVNSRQASFKLSSMAKAMANVTTGSLEVNTRGNSSLNLDGKAEKVAFELSGTSEVDALSLDVPDAEVRMSSLCKLVEAASKTLKINIGGGASLSFAGNPEITVENIRSSTVTPYGREKR